MQNKFFNSKLNTALLAVLIILMIIALKWMFENKKIYTNNFRSEIPTEHTVIDNLQSNGVQTSWKQSPAEFGLLVYYPENWKIMPSYYGSPAMQITGKTDLVGYDFTLPSGSAVVWGGPQSVCNKDDFGVFKYGVSTLACVNGIRSSIGVASAREKVSSNDLKLFGDFVLKNQTTYIIENNQKHWTGKITALDNGCWSDGICKIQIDNKFWITYNIGRNLNHYPIGKIEGDLTLGAKVEVYGEKDGIGGDYTIVGNENYYIKVI